MFQPIVRSQQQFAAVVLGQRVSLNYARRKYIALWGTRPPAPQPLAARRPEIAVMVVVQRCNSKAKAALAVTLDLPSRDPAQPAQARWLLSAEPSRPLAILKQ